MKSRAPVVALAILTLLPLSSALHAGQVVTTGKAGKTEVPVETSPEERLVVSYFEVTANTSAFGKPTGQTSL